MGGLDFLNWTLAIDILVFLVLVFFVFNFFKNRKSTIVAVMFLTYAAVVIFVQVIYLLYDKLYFTTRLLMYLNIFCIVSFCVAYRQDLKAFFNRLCWIKNKDSALSVFTTTEDELKHAAIEIVKACQNMAKNNIGALIIIAQRVVPAHIIETGTVLEARVSAELLESIFITKTPLHDGAVVIKGNTILGAGCFLPLSQASGISKDLGTRHRAAIGITEESDVLAIIVSEETAIISLVHNGEIKRYITPEKLAEAIESAYGLSTTKTKNKKAK